MQKFVISFVTSKVWIFDSSHQNSHTKSRRNQQSFVHLFRRFSLQHLHRYLIQYDQSVRIFLLRHSILHQYRWRNYQSIVHLHFRFHFLEHLYQDTRNLISLSMIWFACFVKSLNHLIYVNIKRILLFRKALTLVYLVNHVLFISHESSFTSCLQSIRKHRLVRIWKIRIQKVFSNIRSRNRDRFALSKKSIISSYKKLNIFYISLQSKFSSRFSFAWFRFTFSSFFQFLISDHVCCICFDHFSFNNDSFNYSRSSHRYFSNRRSMRKKKMKKMIIASKRSWKKTKNNVTSVHRIQHLTKLTFLSYHIEWQSRISSMIKFSTYVLSSFHIFAFHFNIFV